LIGNGWVNPFFQYPAYNYYVYEQGLISQSLFQVLEVAFATCQELINYGTWEQALTECSDAYSEILDNLPSDFNVYNIEAQCVGPLCYNLTDIQNFLNLPAVQEAIGVNVTWDPCDSDVYNALSDDETLSQVDNVAYLLEEGVPVLVYSGDLDFQCNWLGGQNWTNAMEWSGQTGFNNAQYTQNQNYGEFKYFDGLTFYRVYNAGHMVPHDQPAAALDLLTRFMANGTLLDYGEL